jgi:Flp pilus assembly protein TadB
MARAKKDDVQSITSVGTSRSADIDSRQRAYLVKMSIRVLCFILAVVLPVPLPVKLILIAAAAILPWMGVVAANAGPKRQAPAPHTRPGPDSTKGLSG